jgi:protein-tyrosine sulfotransferase
VAGSRLRVRIQNRVERLRRHRWRMAAYTSGARHVVMGGAPRSGTTLLRKMLERHPELCSGAETKLFVPAAFNLDWLAAAYGLPRPELTEMLRRSPSQGAFIDAFARRVTAAAGKPRWAEKTPQNIRHLDWILPRFPSASVIHIVRDGRDVVCSMREHPDWRWVDGGWQKVVVPRPLEWYASRWLADTAAGMAWRQDPRYVEVRYEDLVADPALALHGICEGIGALVDPAWLAQVTAGDTDGDSTDDAAPQRRPDYDGAASGVSIGRWRTDLDADEQTLVMRLCGDRLRELGYAA